MTPFERSAQNPAVTYLSKWSAKSDSRRSLRGALKRVIHALGDDKAEPEDFAWHELRYEHVRSIAAELADEFGPRTVNHALSALRGVLEAAWRSGLLPDDAYRKIEIENVPGSGGKAGRALSTAEMNELHAACTTLSARDAAVVALLAGAGMRRVEVVRLRLGDYEYKSGRVTVTGKRGKKREIPVGERWRRFIECWCASEAASGASFESLLFDLGGKNPRRQVSYIVERFCSTHKLPVFTPHDLRRTFGTHVEQKIGMAGAQQLLGHSNIQTTSLYVRVDEERERAAVKDL